jgi:hypothetical protein
METHATACVGVYTNFLSDEGAGDIEAAYGDRLGRLRAVKNRYDPTNFFRLNANIEPTGDKKRLLAGFV